MVCSHDEVSLACLGRRVSESHLSCVMKFLRTWGILGIYPLQHTLPSCLYCSFLPNPALPAPSCALLVFSDLAVAGVQVDNTSLVWSLRVIL